MDTAVIVSLTATKDTLDTNPEAQRLTFLCEQLFNDEWHDYYSACNLHLVSFGDNPSVFDLPLETATSQYKRDIQNVVTTLSTLGITCAPKTRLKSKRKQIIKSLRIISRFSRYNDAICFGQSVDKSYSRVEYQVLIVLHLHKWIIEKVITLLFTRSVDELASEEKTKRVKHIVVLQSYINTITLGSVINPGHWKYPVKNQQEVGDCSFTDGQAKKVEQQLPAIIVKALVLEGSKAGDWVNVTIKVEWILTTLRHREDCANRHHEFDD
jgi:hypothetical protein